MQERCRNTPAENNENDAAIARALSDDAAIARALQEQADREFVLLQANSGSTPRHASDQQFVGFPHHQASAPVAMTYPHAAAQTIAHPQTTGLPSIHIQQGGGTAQPLGRPQQIQPPIEQNDLRSGIHDGGDGAHAVKNYWSTSCVATTAILMLTYGAVVVLCLLIFFILPLLGFFCVAVCPAGYIACFWAWHWRQHTLARQVIYTSLEAVGLMLPLAIVLVIAVSILDIATGRNLEPSSARDPLGAFVVAFILAAIPEELLKYAAVRHIVWSPHVCDPRALVVYAAVAAASFAGVENLAYVFGAMDAGVGVGVARALFAVPGHVCTGVLIGAGLGKQKFLNQVPDSASFDQRCCSIVRIVALPILIHGSYNFVLMAGGGSLLSVAAAILVDLAGALLARYGVAGLEQVVPVNVHSLVMQGCIPPPRLRCCIALCHVCDGPETVQPYGGLEQTSMGSQTHQPHGSSPTVRIYISVTCPSCTLNLVVFAPALSSNPCVAHSVACPMCGSVFSTVAAAPPPPRSLGA